MCYILHAAKWMSYVVHESSTLHNSDGEV